MDGLYFNSLPSGHSQNIQPVPVTPAPNTIPNNFIVFSLRIFEPRDLFQVLFGCNMKRDLTANNGETFTDLVLFLLTSWVRQ